MSFLKGEEMYYAVSSGTTLRCTQGKTPELAAQLAMVEASLVGERLYLEDEIRVVDEKGTETVMKTMAVMNGLGCVKQSENN